MHNASDRFCLKIQLNNRIYLFLKKKNINSTHECALLQMSQQKKKKTIEKFFRVGTTNDVHPKHVYINYGAYNISN